MPTPLSDILVSEMITELIVDPVFASHTDQQKIQLFNTVAQRIAGLCNAKRLSYYMSDNLVGTPGGILVGEYQAGFELNVPITGVVVTFAEPFTHVHVASGDYSESVSFWADDGNGGLKSVGGVITRAPEGLTLVPDYPAQLITWSVKPFTQ